MSVDARTGLVLEYRGGFYDIKACCLHGIIKVHKKDETVEWRGHTLTIVTDGCLIEVLQHYLISVDATGSGLCLYHL